MSKRVSVSVFGVDIEHEVDEGGGALGELVGLVLGELIGIEHGVGGNGLGHLFGAVGKVLGNWSALFSANSSL